MALERELANMPATVIHEPGDRRFRILRLSSDLLLNSFLFSPSFDRQGRIRVIEQKGLPEGFQVEAVMYDFFSDTFAFRIYHESFEDVFEAHTIPEIHPEFSVRYVHIDKTKEDVVDFYAKNGSLGNSQ